MMTYRLSIFIVLSLLLAACGGNAAPTDVPPATNTSAVDAPTATPTIEASATAILAQAVAPDDPCPDFVETTLSEMDKLCDTTGRNQACYGNSNLVVSPQANVDSLKFDSPGDIANVTDIQSIKLSALDTAKEVWGIALLRLQANLPDTNPGQNVTFLLFGNVELENRSQAGTNNIQSFYFSSGIGDSACNSAPESGMLIQTPQGVGKIDLLINEVNIDLGSTAYLQAEPDSDFTINVVEGEAVVTSQGKSETVPAGTRSSVKLDANGIASSPPSPAEPYQVAPLRRLPVSHLQRPVTIHEFVDKVAAAPIGFEVSDTISAAGESDIFTFDAVAGQSIYLDGIEGTSDIGWELQSADGTGIHAEARITFDMDTISLPDTGSYQIVVKSVGGSGTGNYKFKVWDVPPDDVLELSLPPDAPAQLIGSVEGAIETPGTVDRVKFSATAGQTLYFDGVEASSGFSWTVLDSAGTVVASEARINFDIGNVVMPVDGDYQVIVDGVGDAFGTYKFNIWNVPQDDQLEVTLPADAPAQLIGSIDGAIESPGTADHVKFSATAGQTLYFDGMEATSGFSWTVLDSAGTVVASEARINFDIGNVVMPADGDYEVLVDGVGDAFGTYKFNIWNVPPDDQLELTVPSDAPPQLIGSGQGAIESPGTVDRYTFSASAGQTLFFDGVEATGGFSWSVLDSEGEVVASESRINFDIGNVLMPADGDYQIVVVGVGDSIGTYIFNVFNVPDETQSSSSVVPDDAPAQLLGKVEGNISSSGVKDSYPISVTAGQTIYFDGLSADAGIQWRVFDAEGKSVSATYGVQYDFENISFDTAGDYSIVVEGNGASTGNYAFQYWNVPPPDAMSLSLPDSAPDRLIGRGSGTIETPGVKDIYTLTVTVGQTIYFDGLDSDAQIQWEVLDSAGTSLSSNYDVQYDLENITFDQAGDYQLVVSGYIDAVGEYAFQLWDVPAPETRDLIHKDDDAARLIGTGSGELFTPGEEHIYPFDVEADERLYFDGVSNGDSNLVWKVQNPETGEDLTSSYQVQYDLANVTFATAGTYQVIVDGSQDSIGTYEFRLWEGITNNLPLTIPEDAPPNLLGSISGTILSPGQIDYYPLDMIEGQSVYFDGIDGTVYIYWDLLDKDLNSVLNKTAVMFDMGKFTSESDATYQVQVNNIENAEIGDYQFKIWNIPEAENYPLTIGETISGTTSEHIANIESPGAEDIYTFSVKSGDMLEFDGIETPLFLLWRVEDADGNEIIPSNNIEFNIPPTIFEQAGDYRLIVSGQEDAYGLYAFQIRIAQSE